MRHMRLSDADMLPTPARLSASDSDCNVAQMQPTSVTQGTKTLDERILKATNPPDEDLGKIG